MVGSRDACGSWCAGCAVPRFGVLSRFDAGSSILERFGVPFVALEAWGISGWFLQAWSVDALVLKNPQGIDSLMLWGGPPRRRQRNHRFPYALGAPAPP